MQTILACQDLHKQFADHQVLRGIDLDIREGEIFGLVGTNGAGKSTLIKCLLQLINPSKGTITFQGKPIQPQQIEQRFGFLPEKFLPYGNLTAPEMLRILAWGSSIERQRVDELLAQLQLDKHKNLRIKHYSRGMIQRLGLAMSLLKNPQILVLDEPSLGLDIVGQRQMMEFLRTLNEAGTTIFFTSHIFAHVEKLCHRIGVLCQGKIVYVGEVAGFLQKHQVDSLEEAFIKEIEI